MNWPGKGDFLERCKMLWNFLLEASPKPQTLKRKEVASTFHHPYIPLKPHKGVGGLSIRCLHYLNHQLGCSFLYCLAAVHELKAQTYTQNNKRLTSIPNTPNSKPHAAHFFCVLPEAVHRVDPKPQALKRPLGLEFESLQALPGLSEGARTGLPSGNFLNRRNKEVPLFTVRP